MRRTLLFALLCTLIGSPVLAAPTWTHASSDHFEIFTTGGDRKAREALAYFERVRSYFFAQANLSPRLARPIRLVVFSNAREFTPYRPYEAARAYYRSSTDRDYIVMQSFGPDAYPVVAHEFVHMILARSGTRYPVWLNEGLAEYYSTVSLLGSLVTVGRAPDIHLQSLSETDLLPLDKLFEVTRDASDYRLAEHAGLYYAESWALTHMLLAHDRYRPRSTRFFDLVRGGTSSASAFRSVYAKSVAEVEADLRNYLRDGRYVERTTRYRPPASGRSAPAETMTAFDADLALANLLAAGREDQQKARLAFDALAELDPDNVRLLESQALFENRANRALEARGYYARAVELGSTDAQTYRDYALLVGTSDPALRVDLLRRAVSLQPADVNTRVNLANLILARDPAGVLAVLEPVSGPNPTRAFEVFQLRTYAYLELNQLELAHNVARDLVRVAGTNPRLQTTAATVLASVERSLAVQTRAAQ